MRSESFKVEKKVVEKGDRDSILSIWEGHKMKAPEIKKKKVLSIQEVMDGLGAESGDLQEKFAEEMTEFAQMFKDSGYAEEEDVYKIVENIYSLYLHRAEGEIDENLSWISQLESFDQFADTFLEGVAPGVRSKIRRWLESFIRVRVNPYRMLKISVFPDGFKMWEDIYTSEGDWTLMPSWIENVRAYQFVEKSIIKEAMELIKDGYSAPDFHHGTGSAALAGISKHKAILSARESKKRGEVVKTGEFATYVASDSGHPVSGGELGLASVYASKGNPFLTGYQTVNWFDEFPISFGINAQKQADFLRSTEFRYEYSTDGEGLVREYGSEGTLIGDQVTLDAVETVYCLQVNREEVKEWAKQNCPDVKIISLEAIETLRFHERDINKIALQEGIAPEEAWSLLLK